MRILLMALCLVGCEATVAAPEAHLQWYNLSGTFTFQSGRTGGVTVALGPACRILSEVRVTLHNAEFSAIAWDSATVSRRIMDRCDTHAVESSGWVAIKYRAATLPSGVKTVYFQNRPDAIDNGISLRWEWEGHPITLER